MGERSQEDRCVAECSKERGVRGVTQFILEYIRKVTQISSLLEFRSSEHLMMFFAVAHVFRSLLIQFVRSSSSLNYWFLVSKSCTIEWTLLLDVEASLAREE